MRRSRTSRVVELMNNLNLDHLILTGHDQIRYATDYRSLLVSEANDWCALVFSREAEGVMLVPDVDQEELLDGQNKPILRRVPVPSWSPASLHPHYWIEHIGFELLRGRAKRVGFDRIPWNILQGLTEKFPDIEIVGVEKELFELRAVKEKVEIRLLELAGELNIDTIHKAFSQASKHNTDAWILGQIAAGQLSGGAEAFTHSMCNVRGSESWFPQGVEVGPRGAFFIDVGCYGVGGYASDLTRTCFVGEPDTTVSAAYKVLQDALRIGQEIANAGVRVSLIDSAVNSYLISHGLPGTPYSMGHGIGLRSCEVPTVYRGHLMDDDKVLEIGNVISLEPETRVTTAEGTYVLKLEDNFVIEPGGARSLVPPAYDEPLIIIE
ncbi:MAG: M24 family metallopeptidase [Actinobacteria bacterium]|nr:M24 family metallopeptidase [Actinomycetota bacterium]MTB20358.1 M24 family metallopeptidase [Actinomycetota bacterium]